MARIRFRVDLTPGCSIGPGKIQLLESILATGSLSEAARSLGMSYRRAWLLLDNLNRSFNVPVTRATVGGRGGGGVVLTPFARELIEGYRKFEAELQLAADRGFRAVREAAKPARAAGKSAVKRPTVSRPARPEARKTARNRP